MGRMKNQSANWLATLHQLREIILREYPGGGRLPAVPEMSRRLNVSESTYCKALRAVCQHGLASARQGRGGTQILPQAQRTLKIGVVTAGITPLLPQQPLLPLIQRTVAAHYATQMISGARPHGIYDQMTILNISALYVVNPPDSYFPALQQLQERRIPLAIVEYYNYSRIDEAQRYQLPYFHTAPDCVARGVCDFADRYGYGSILLLDLKPTVLSANFARICRRSGREFNDNHFLPFARIEKSLCPRIRKNQIELLFAHCNPVHARLIIEQLLRLPEPQRPALIFPSSLQERIKRDRPAGITIAGYFDLDTAPYELASTRLIEAMENETSVSPEECQVFSIIPNH